jgi:hypothetical protein
LDRRSFGLSAVLQWSGLAYLVAIPAFFAVLKPVPEGLHSAAT